MSDDIVLVRRHLTNSPNLCLSDYDIKNYALAEIEKLLNDIGKSLTNFPDMPFPGEAYFSNSDNRLILEETSYDTEEMKKIHEKIHSLLNDEQKRVYDSILDNINQKKVVFSSFTGVEVVERLSCGRHYVVDYAAVLLPGGRTAHSRFHIPLKLDEHYSVGLRHGTDISKLIQQTDLIIWDEAPMQHRHAFECVDRSLRDIMSVVDKRRAKKPFGGITIVFGGDFRQILPIIPKASRAEVVCTTLNKSKLWDSCEVFLLKQNMWLNAGNTESENKIIAEFSKWQLEVGDGKETNISPDSDSGKMLIKIRDQYIIHTSGDPIQKIFEVTYPDFLQNISSHEYLRSRAILTPINIVVDEINIAMDEISPTNIIF
ncbi:uncharacterized protein LOC141685197 [Apium graveolens]|uniref:uncharacterized protein LOC141685197 n=1 Tax=Apium graveolens TaxID=4045 RepID=UPI003D7C0A39